MARETRFSNRKGAEQGIIEVLDLNETDLNEKSATRYTKNMSGTTDFPYPKTLAGAL